METLVPNSFTRLAIAQSLQCLVWPGRPAVRQEHRYLHDRSARIEKHLAQMRRSTKTIFGSDYGIGVFIIWIGDIQPLMSDASLSIDADAAYLFAADGKTRSAAKPVTKI